MKKQISKEIFLDCNGKQIEENQVVIFYGNQKVIVFRNKCLGFIDILNINNGNFTAISQDTANKMEIIGRIFATTDKSGNTKTFGDMPKDGDSISTYTY